MQVRRAAWICLILLIGAASAVPLLPAEFSGSVTIDGNPAPAGTVITARIDDRDCGLLTLEKAGVYGGAGTFDKRLLVCGGEDDDKKTIMFTVNGKPAGTAAYNPGTSISLDLAITSGVAFSANVTAGVAPLTVRFTDESTGNVTSWSWSFGDGNTSTDQNPTHTYMVPGNYTVALTVSRDSTNTTMTKERYIQVQPALPSAELLLNINHNRGTTNDTIASGTSPCDLSYLIGAHNRPGNREEIRGNIIFTLDASGITGVEPKEYAEIEGTQITWTLPESTAINPGTTLSTMATTNAISGQRSGVTLERSCNRTVFTEAGVQQVTLNITFDTVDPDRFWGRITCIETDNVQLAIIPDTVSTDLPHHSLIKENTKIQFEINRSAVEAGRQYTLSCAVGVNPLQPVAYAPSCAIWEVWNSTSVTAPAGTAVTLPAELLPENISNITFSSATPCEWTCIQNDHVITTLYQRAIPVSAPAANFTANVTIGVAPLAVQFTDLSTGDPTAWLWSFGDGATSTEQHPVHTYTAPGTYTVSLTATNAGGSSTESKTDYITVMAPPPVADFSANVTVGPAPLTVHFTDTSAGEITAWLWNFGDNTTATTRDAIHTYEAIGVYTARLTITGPGGNDTTERTIIVTSPETDAAFTASVTAGVAPLTVRFTDTSAKNPSSWFWDFGDGNTSTAQNPIHTYTIPGNHTVTLSINGNLSTATKPGYIKVTPVLFGDANEDGRVNQADTLTVLQQVVGIQTKPTPGTDRFRKTDVNVNGEIDVGDALFIAQHNVGLRDVWFTLLQ